MTVDYSVENYPAQQVGLSQSPYLSTAPFRLASQAQAWTDPSCGNCAGWTSVSAPQVIPQWTGGPYGPNSCSQSYDDNGNILPWGCADYYVALGGYAGQSNTALAQDLDTYTLWTCTVPPSNLEQETESVYAIQEKGVSGIASAFGIAIGVVSFVALLVGLVVAYKFGKLSFVKELSEPLQV